MKPIIIISSLFFSLAASGQPISFNDCRQEGIVFELAETMPMPTGGKDSLRSFLQKHIEYVGLAKSTVNLNIQLLIDKDGNVCLGFLHNLPSELSVQALQKSMMEMPKWNPATQNNYKVNCWARLLVIIESGNINDIIYSTVANKSVKF